MASGRQTCYIVGTKQQDNGVSDVNSNGLRNIYNEPHTLDGIITERQKTHTNIQSISIESGDAKRNKNKNVYLSYRRPSQDYGFHILDTSRRHHGIQESGENREETIAEQPMHVSSLDDGEINGNDTGTRTKFIYALPQNDSLKILIVKRVMSISLAIAELSINWLILYKTHLPAVSNRMNIIQLLVWISIAIDMLFASLQIVNSIGETIYEATKGRHGFRILHGWKEVVLSIIFGEIPQYISILCAIVVYKVECQDISMGFEIVIGISSVSVINKIVRWVTCLQHPENRYCCSCNKCMACCCQFYVDNFFDDCKSCRDHLYCLCCCEHDDDKNFYCCCLMSNDDNMHLKVRNDCCFCKNGSILKPVLKDPQYTCSALLTFFVLYLFLVVLFVTFSIIFCKRVHI